MKVALYQLDGKLPNLALMRISGHHKAKGDRVELFRPDTLEQIQSDLFFRPDIVYGSILFDFTMDKALRLKSIFPDAIIGGPAWDLSETLELRGVAGNPDYSIYPECTYSLGYSQRGCRLRCSFCVVPKAEGSVKHNSVLSDIWRGDPLPKDIVLLDNDIFGNPRWAEILDEAMDYRVSICQGINVRIITVDQAEALARVNCRSLNFKEKRIYAAWDATKDEKHFMRGMRRMIDAGINPRNVMVYMLIGYENSQLESDWEYRREKIRGVGAVPYPMPYDRNKSTVGFQRFVCGAYDKRFSWQDFKSADFRPEKMGKVE